MDYIYNITFFVGKERLETLLSFLRGEFLETALSGAGVELLHLTRVVNNQAMGMMEGEEQAVSLGMQFSAADKTALDGWCAGALHRAFEDLTARFGDEVLHFDTLLEVL